MNAQVIHRPARWSAPERFVLGTVFLVLCFTPAFFHQQFVTGTMINATLLVCAVAMGAPQAALFGVLPSVVAAASGTLPLALTPLVPFIVVSNAVLVFTFAALYRRSPAAAWIAAALLKFALLSLVSAVAVGYLVPVPGLRAAAVLLSWPQLVTALAGGAVALGVLRGRGGRS